MTARPLAIDEGDGDDPTVVGLEYDRDVFSDSAAEDIVFVAYGIASELERMHANRETLERLGYPQVAVDAHQAAFRTVQRLFQRHDVEEFADDASAIDDDLMVDIAETFTPVASAFVEDFDLPVAQPTSIIGYPAPSVILGGANG